MISLLVTITVLISCGSAKRNNNGKIIVQDSVITETTMAFLEVAVPVEAENVMEQHEVRVILIVVPSDLKSVLIVTLIFC